MTTTHVYMVARRINGDLPPDPEATGPRERPVVGWKPVEGLGRHATHLEAVRAWWFGDYPEIEREGYPDDAVRRQWRAHRANVGHYKIVRVQAEGVIAA